MKKIKRPQKIESISTVRPMLKPKPVVDHEHRLIGLESEIRQLDHKLDKMRADFAEMIGHVLAGALWGMDVPRVKLTKLSFKYQGLER